jgi:hypothetical protein
MPPSAFDDLPGPDWIDPEEDRAFYCDAFISHRRFDQSESLGASLTNKGVRVWHDTNADLADRRVRDYIRLALASSRTVVVCLEGHPRRQNGVGPNIALR